ncbi:MAG: hypothetical protein AB7P04_07155 [Bacteriovoracia bacterium]
MNRNPFSVFAAALTCFASITLATAAPTQAAAEASGFSANAARSTELGLIIGEPLALSGKFWMGNNAIGAGLGYSFNSYLLIFGDYLWHFPGLFGSRHEFLSRLLPYVGVGGYFGFSTDRRSQMTNGAAALRIPFGAEYILPKAPVSFTLELVPGIRLAPSTGVILQGGLAIRYCF